MIAVLLFLGGFGIYLFSLSGTIPAYRDSGDMINAVYTFGIAHPPGYPTYILTGKIFTTLVPWGNVAYRVNAFSAFCAAVSLVLVYITAKNLLETSLGQSERTMQGVCALTAALLFGMSPAVLSLGRVAEMYTLA